MAFPVGWTKRRTITIPAAQVGTGGVTSFTAYLEVVCPGAQADGDDVRFTSDEAGTTELAVDLLEWVAGTETARVRVGPMSLSSVVANTIYAWWGEASATRPAAGDANGQYAAYDSDWKAYWPLESDVNDRTTNGHHLTTEGTWTYASGKLSNAPEAQASTGNLAYRNSVPVAGDPLTLVGWAYFTSDSVNHYIVNISSAKGATSSTNNTIGLQRTATSTTLGAFTRQFATSTSTLTGTTKDAWHFIAGTFADGGASRFIIRGTTKGTEETTDRDVSSQAYINIRCDYMRPSHMQAHGVVRSDAWLATEYNATNDPASFRTLGDVVDLGGTAHTATINDSAGVTDAMSPAVSYARTVADAAGITDAAAGVASYSRGVAESIGATDAAGSAVSYSRDLAEAMGIADAAGSAVAYARAFAESLGLADVLAWTKGIEAIINDGVGVADVVERVAAWVLAVDDSAGVADAVAREAAYLRSIADAEGASDTADASASAAVRLLRAALAVTSRLTGELTVGSRMTAGLRVGSRLTGSIEVNQ